ncbi:hypothetical protein LXT21_35975 [Myxococcus sp. K38C18041901]|uniref:hypothetical protein n=1 Tax=Myxococcus guangdongensis TaxID=2906760 RepID=UPI0020A7CAB3|nr:hypothetical protein [Myxococcus guangdongensis]MCP3064185.1 hypothetical protein [Myxococcus guangdongensis]
MMAWGLCACDTEEIHQLRDTVRTARLVHVEMHYLVTHLDESARELQAIEQQLHRHCPPAQEDDLRALLAKSLGGAEASLLQKDREGVVLRLQGTGAERGLEAVETLGRSAPFLSLVRLSRHQQAWSMDLASGPACPTLQAVAATVTRFPLPPRGMFWPGTSQELREEIIATERDIQRWESTVLAGGLAKLNSRLALLERLRTRQSTGLGHLTGQLPLAKGFLQLPVAPSLTLSHQEDGRWLLEGDLAGMEVDWFEHFGRAGYGVTGDRSGPLLLIHRSPRKPTGG